MPRSSQQEQDAIVWQTEGLPLGLVGLDLRQPTDPRALAKNLNARFSDERSIERRNGYGGVLVQDASSFPQSLDEDDLPISVPMGADGWIYGHGQRLTVTSGRRQTDHYPIPRIARGTFNLNGADVVWTGDRMLVVRKDGYPSLGQSAYWNLDNDTDELAYGIPAYLPVQVDSFPPSTASSDYTETCLTNSHRIVVAVYIPLGSTTTLGAWIIDRDTGALIDQTDLGGDSAPVNPRVFQSGDYVVCVWRDSVTSKLYLNYWNGTQWSGASLVSTSVAAFEVGLVPGGFHLLRREGSTLKLGRYAGKSTQSTPYPFGSTLTVSGGNPNGLVAVAADTGDNVCVVWAAADGLKQKVYNPSLTSGVQSTLNTTVGWEGVTVCAKKLSATGAELTPTYRFVVHAGTTNDPDGTVVRFWESGNVVKFDARWNAKVASKSFRVGDEVFCWLRSTGSDTLFLVSGAYLPRVTAIADREEAKDRTALSQVVQDPLDEHRFTWARPYETGQSYTHAGNARIGDLNFLPQLSAVQYGKSVYIAGSLVRNWDGFELGDAGFQDYPAISANSQDATDGSLTLLGVYRARVYPVRYNKQGERFQGPAITYTAPALTGSNNRIGWQIPTIPCTNHGDVFYEVYRTEAGGTTYYLDGTVTNSLTLPSVVYYSTISDATLITRPGDSHQAGVGVLSELEELGPIGCELLAVSSDRLWGAGGQVPRGSVQFSKLKEQGEGAGFDAIAGFQEIDTEGGRITSIVGYGDATLMFETDRVYILTGAGEDNFGRGEFSTPQLRLVDGAITHVGSVVTHLGVAYWASNGPRLIDAAFRVQPISAPVRRLTETMIPSGVQISLARQEVVWFTEAGKAVLWNYQTGNRWAEWAGLKIAGCSASALVTTDGRLLTESEDAHGDDGVPFAFTGSSGEIATSGFGSNIEINAVGITGKYHGSHRLRVKVFYNGSPLWSERWEWQPDNNTWLETGDDHEDQTPAQIDALKPSLKSGAYATHKRVTRHNARHFRVEWSDVSSDRPTYTPHELTVEIGTRGGLGKVPVNSFGD